MLVGSTLLVGHLAALFAGCSFQEKLKAFPRSETAGIVLFIAAAAWFAGLIAFTDLGEFSPMRTKFLIFSVVGSLLMLRFVREFLAVRALGMLLLLVAEPLLESAWMRPDMGRLWLVGLVYGWIVTGLFFIGKPYVMRDALEWVSAASWRWKLAVWSGIGYGVLLLAVRTSLGT